ncbi:transposase [Alteromonas sp. RKMC-009]|uniref:transposase n=1 Tax=Alteromonas sp. RKMC-009 TaxID=2267264 RepID=UPI0010C304FB|nr:transposase [Alteromonas sp. RKMC-009]AYA66283.2 transposase [Alteromonas sp. RKMC-009]
MARKLRTSPAGIPQLVQRTGRKGVSPFRDDTDRLTYLDYLGRYAQRYKVAMHAWVAGKDSILFLCTPAAGDGISLMLQATGRLYAQYFHQRYGTSGAIWRDRYKSALVLDDELLLEVYRFIEQKPVNEALCSTPEQYAWSSVSTNALGLPNTMVTPHSAYERTAKQPEQRRALHLQHLQHQNNDLDADIAKSLKMGLAMGDPGFIKRIEQVTGRRLTEGKRGRPRKKAVTS